MITFRYVCFETEVSLTPIDMNDIEAPHDVDLSQFYFEGIC